MTPDDSSMLENFEMESSFIPFLKEKALLLSEMIEGKKVLEVGCGTADLLQFFSSKDFDLSGSDYSDVYLDKAREKNLPTKLFKADLLDKASWSKYENQFDTVIAPEVIEHINEHVMALKTIFYILKPGGVLVLTVPAFNFLYTKQDEKIGHFRRYSKKSICKAIEEAGFHIESSRYWNLLGLFGWLLNFKILKKDMKDVIKEPTISILGKWLRMEKKIIMPIGLTVIVKARK